VRGSKGAEEGRNRGKEGEKAYDIPHRKKIGFPGTGRFVKKWLRPKKLFDGLLFSTTTRKVKSYNCPRRGRKRREGNAWKVKG